MKKKIIFVTKALWYGGIETALVNLLKGLNPERYDITVLLLCKERDMASRLPEYCHLIVADREETVSFQKPYLFSRLFHLTEPTQSPSRLHRSLMWMTPAVKWLENRLYIRYIRKNLPPEHYDTCVIYSDVAAETAVRAVRAEKYLMFYHHGAMRRVYHDTIGYEKSQAVICVSRAQAEKLKAFRPEFAHKVCVIHNLTDVDGIREKAKQPILAEFSQEQFHIVSCGRISREKGMDLAVEACAALVKQGYENLHWWIVGGGPTEAEVRQLIVTLGMEDHVTVTGMLNNPYPYIARADLYVQPSRFEGYPMTILEALCLGCPIVSTDNGGAGEILQDGKEGHLCPISAVGIAKAVQRLLQTPAEREQLRQNAQDWDPEGENRKNIRALEELL